jgi:hypothetical protein
MRIAEPAIRNPQSEILATMRRLLELVGQWDQSPAGSAAPSSKMGKVLDSHAGVRAGAPCRPASAQLRIADCGMRIPLPVPVSCDTGGLD